MLILYAVTAGFGLLSLALLHGESMMALVLVVIGLGVWFGVQQLRYAEFSELYALARRSMQRRRIIAHNLQVRQATQALDSCADVAHLCQILRETLEPLGFDGFTLMHSQMNGIPHRHLPPLQRLPDGGLRYVWNGLRSSEPGWELKFELFSNSGDRWGQFSVFRECFEEPLLVDINLLNGEFRRALSAAVDRTLTPSESDQPEFLYHHE